MFADQFRILFISFLFWAFSFALIARDMGLVWPSMGKISSPYGKRYGFFHSGIDIDDSRGRDIRAADSGVVTFSGMNGRYGYMIIVRHDNGIETLYAHNANNFVDVGEEVLQGQKIAKMGSSGRSTGRHLHFEVRIDGQPVDPLGYLKDH